MAEGNKYGFGGIGASGGIANLVAAPKVNQVRGMQFAPAPQRRLTPKKDPKKNVLGALTGAVSPFLAEAGLEGLAKIPGFEKFLFEPENIAQDRLGVSDPQTGLATVTDPYSSERAKLRKRVDQALPPSKLPKQKTTLGKGLSQLLTYAPALALDDEEGSSISSFINAAQNSGKLRSTLENTQLDNFLRRSTERGKALSQPTDLTELTVHSYYNTDDGFTSAHQTRALRAKDGTTYVMSRGNPDVDVDIDGNFVKAGQYYLNPRISFQDGSSPEAKTKTYLDTNSSLIIEGINTEVRDEFGNANIQSLFIMPDGSKMSRKQFREENPTVNLIGYNQALYSSRNPPTDSVDPKIFEQQKELSGRTEALNRMLTVSADVMRAAYINIPVDKNGEYVVTDPNTGQPNWDIAQFSELSEGAAKLTRFIDSNFLGLQDNLRKAGFGKANTTPFADFIESQVDPKKGTNVLGVASAIEGYHRALDPIANVDERLQDRARDNLLIQLETLQESAQDGNYPEGKPAWLNFDRAELQTYLDQKGQYAASQVRLAYMAASATGQTGRTLSDRDIAFFMDQLGFGDNLPSTIAKKVASFGTQELLAWDGANEERGLLVRERENFGEIPLAQQKIVIDKHHGVLAGQFGFSPRQKEKLDRLTTLSQREADALAADIQNNIISRNASGLGIAQWQYDPKTKSFRYVPFVERFEKQDVAEELKRYWRGVGYDLRGPDSPYYNQPSSVVKEGEGNNEALKTMRLQLGSESETVTEVMTEALRLQAERKAAEAARRKAAEAARRKD